MIIDISYFTGPLLITGLSATGTGVAVQITKAKKDNLNYFIAKYENQFLNYLLGENLANEFKTEIEKETHDVKWDTLLSKLKKTEIIGTTNYNYSFIANYIYYYYQRNELTDTTSTGEYDAPQRMTIINKSVFAWNSMVNDVMKFLEWMDEVYKDYYTDYDSFSINKDLTNYINSLGI